MPGLNPTNSQRILKFIFVGTFLLCLLPFVSAAIALISGIVLALAFGNPYSSLTKKATPHFLTVAIIGLGFGMNLQSVVRVGFEGIVYTSLGIATTFLLSYFIGCVLKTRRDLFILITSGTAICGGSAIAAVSPAIGASNDDTSVALITIFLLNAVALFLFPILGHYFQLSETQFGLWSALAIHDTSSVVGATLQYGPHALEVGTTVKLARALWIVPVTLLIAYFHSRAQRIGQDGIKTNFKFKKPWFIVGFLAAAALITWVPSLKETGHFLEIIAKRLLVLTLFLIGSGLSQESLRAVGLKPFLHGAILWLFVSALSLAFILVY